MSAALSVSVVADAAPQLEALLDQQLGVLSELVEVMQEERRALIELDVARIEALTLEKEKLCARQEVLERARLELVGRAGLARLSLRELGEELGDAAGARLLELRSSLRALAATLDDLNELNQGLLQHAKACVGATVRVLRDSLSDQPTYGRGGRMRSARPPGGAALSSRL